MYLLAIGAVLALHLLFILWVIFGALFTRGRAVLRWLHIISLLWAITFEVTPWPCPLTLLEDSLRNRAGIGGYGGGFIVYYLDALVYPNISLTLLIIAGVGICVFNLGIYVLRWRESMG